MSNGPYFWDWVRGAEGQRSLRDLSGLDGQAVVHASDVLSKALKSVNPHLGWVFVLGKNGKPATLQISGDGISAMIPIVQKLVDEAPEITGLHVVAFRQADRAYRLSLPPDGKYGLDADSTLCVPTAGDAQIYELQVYLPVPEGTPEAECRRSGSILLNHVLGEYNVMTKVGAVSFSILRSDGVPPNAISLGEFANRLAAG